MDSKKYQIFVSSTYEDLKKERDQVIKAILEMGHIPVGMEMFSAADEQQWEIIKKQIDESDYYVVIVAHRYGSMDGEVSYTEKEYDYAISKDIPVLGFVIDPEVDWQEKWRENNSTISGRLESFKTKITSRMVSHWKNEDDLYGKCGIALMKTFNTQPRDGWVRSSQTNATEMVNEITRLSRENGELRRQISEVQHAQESQHDNRVNQIIDALRLNERITFVWLEGQKDWGERKEVNLLQIFETIGPDMIDEASNETIANSIALEFGGISYRTDGWSVPRNFVKRDIADMVSLDLVTTSPKRHGINDTAAYWTLTDFGKEVFSRIRNNKLLKGLAVFEESPEDEGGDESES